MASRVAMGMAGVMVVIKRWGKEGEMVRLIAANI